MQNSKNEFNRGMNEMSEIIKRLCTLNINDGLCEDIYHIFGVHTLKEVLDNFSAEEIKKSVEDWDNKKIEVGDIIQCGAEYGLTILVTSINKERYVYEGISSDGETYYYPMNGSYIHKSKNHIDLKELLDRIQY